MSFIFSTTLSSFFSPSPNSDPFSSLLRSTTISPQNQSHSLNLSFPLSISFLLSICPLTLWILVAKGARGCGSWHSSTAAHRVARDGGERDRGGAAVLLHAAAAAAAAAASCAAQQHSCCWCCRSSSQQQVLLVMPQQLPAAAAAVGRRGDVGERLTQRVARGITSLEVREFLCFRFLF